jgi:CRP-like cAMP-binding protein
MMRFEAESLNDLRQAALLASLRQCRIFTGLSSSDLATVAAGCGTRLLKKGEVLYHEGDVTEGFFVVQLGQIGTYWVDPDGRQKIYSVFRTADCFAEVALTAVGRYLASAVALEYSRVILVRKGPFCALIERKPQLALQMLASMSLHLTQLLRLIRDSSGRQIEARLAEWLLRQSPAAAAGCPAVFELPVAKKVIANQLGVTSATLSRAFAHFRRSGVIRVVRSRIHVLDGARLRAGADGQT